ncbi:MAG: hypothetical protein H0U76_24720 [Ktedonobacteraceae bacterium]|nr:hypothetical protein [Ktedonobacteraceae bacterium]MBA3923426.1 hypothetical protein [Nostocaceae cyanobacterium]
MVNELRELLNGVLQVLRILIGKSDKHTKELENQRTDIGRALLEIREAKSAVTDWLADQVKLELLEQEIRELKAEVSGLRTEIQQLKSRWPEDKDSD